MGNQVVIKKYDLSEKHAATAGLNRLYKIYHGVNKETKAEVSVWNLSKDDLLKRDVPVKDKAVQEQLFMIIRKDIAYIKDAGIDSAGILRAIEVFDENKNSFSFVTERVICSLADVINRFDGVPGGLSNCSQYLEENGTLSEIEISRGLLNITEGLQYMHHIQRKLHANVSPENIVIVSGGQWKLCGFGHSLGFAPDDFKAACPYFIAPQSSVNVIRLEPDLRYCSMEMTYGGYNPTNARMVGPAADIFSLGVVIYEMYRFNLTLAPQGRSNVHLVSVQNNAVPQHQLSLESVLPQLDTSSLPSSTSQLMCRILKHVPESRATAMEILNSPCFSAGTLAVLRAVDTMATKDIGTQAAQLNSLPALLSDCSPRILESAVLLTVSRICLQSPGLWVYALPLHVFVAERIPPASYIHTAAPFIKEGLAVQQPTETMQAFLKNLSHIQFRFDAQFFREYFIGKLLQNSLDKKLSNLQIMALHILCDEQVRSKLDPTVLKEDILPRVCREACKSSDMAVKMKAIYFMSLVVRILDDTYLAANFIPSLKYILDNDRSSSTVMCVLGVYRAMTNILNSETLSTSMIPALGPLMADKNLSAPQFEILVHIFYSVTNKLVESRCHDLGSTKISLHSVESRTITDAELFSTALNVPQSLVPTAPTSSSSKHSVLQLPGSSNPSLPSSDGFLQSSSTNRQLSDVIPPSYSPAPPSYTPAPPTPPSYAPAPPPISVQSASVNVVGSSLEPYRSSSSLVDAKTSDATAQSSSWFSFSKPKAAEVASYVPPVAPLPIQSPPQTNLSQVQSTGSNAGNIDLDDFMSSFAKKPSQTTSVSVASASVYTPYIAPSSVSSVGASSIAIQEQIRQTQLEINKLSGGIDSVGFQAASTSYPTTSTLAPSQSTAMNMGIGGMAMGTPIQTQTAPFPGGYPQPTMQQMQTYAPGQYGYAAQQPVGQSFYSQSSIVPGQPQHMQYTTTAYQTGLGGYQPPMMPAMTQQSSQLQFQQQQQQQQHQQQQRLPMQGGASAGAKTSDPFDFLS